MPIAAGAAIIVLVFSDIFQSVIVPRAVARGVRLSAYLWRGGWRVWRWSGFRFVQDNDLREDMLATFAPVMLVVLLIVWTLLLVVGYGLVFFGLIGGVKGLTTFSDAWYFAGTSLLTLGYGDLVAQSAVARAIALVAAGSGLGVVAIVTSYLFSLFGNFQSREVFVVTHATRAGAPPSGVEFLINHAKLEMRASLRDDFRDGQRWAAMLMESHLAYPVLAFFRSSHDSESWVATLGSLLDAAVLMMTAVDDGASGEATIMFKIGSHLVRDLTRYYALPTADESGVEREEFESACGRLREAGYAITIDDATWEKFRTLRDTYSAGLGAMARFWAIPPALWVGDRSRSRIHHDHSIAGAR